MSEPPKEGAQGYQLVQQAGSHLLGGSPEKVLGETFEERYALSEELPPSLITLVKKLDAVEGYQLSRARFLANETPSKAVGRSVARLSSHGHKLGQVCAEALQIAQGWQCAASTTAPSILRHWCF
jgi:hypothetical protein